MSKTDLPRELQQYMEEIAKRLWNGRVSIIVGAGFSLNATTKIKSNNTFPDWKMLGDIFYKKIHGEKPSKQEHYLNVLRLAEEIEATWDRPTLDQLLIDSIPDELYNPSNLHKMLLELPWNNVFTTNYDTLLERASNDIIGNKYSVIIDKKDFFHAKSHKIIKLHGSFPSHKPFIITEEDYRKYPTQFSPFVTYVQQALLTDTICLIGFSGEDPNFLEWNGWLIDNLGNDAQKVYLVGLLNLSETQKKLLNKRNIIPLDLGCCEGVNGEYGKAVDEFIKAMMSYKKEEIVDEHIGWPERNISYYYSHDKNFSIEIPIILENWNFNRQNFPGWEIIPDDRRDVLINYTEGCHSFIYKLGNIRSPIDIQFLYEYNWRIEKCLIPINNDLIVFYENTIGKYNPFPLLINIENSIDPNTSSNNDIDWDEISGKWIEIQLSMLRFYREEGFIEKWNLMYNRLNKLINHLKPEISARFYYECCLFGLFCMNIAEVQKYIKTWPLNNNLPFWEAKRAGILAEIGNLIEAEKILENSLESIQNLVLTATDYTYFSQEAYTMQLLKYVKGASNIFKGVYIVPEEVRKHYAERWNKLVTYKCDPWGELELFKLHLDRAINESNEVEKKYRFDIGEVTLTHHFSADKYVSKAYSYLRYVEEIAIPFRLPATTFGKEASYGAFRHIAKHSPYWAFATLIRIGDPQLCDSLFDRRSISKLPFEKVDILIDNYLSILKGSKEEIKNGDIIRNTTYAISLATVIPEILSRLSVKCSSVSKIKLLSFLLEIYESEDRNKYKGIGNLTRRLICSFSQTDQYRLIPFLLEFPVLTEFDHLIDEEYVDPFSFIKLKLLDFKKSPKIKIKKARITYLLKNAKKLGKARQTAVRRLKTLLDINCLTKEQTDQFVAILYSNVDKITGFPLNTNYYNFSFLNFPSPEGINPEQLLRNYIKMSPFPVQSSLKDKGVSITRGRIHIFQDIFGTTNSNVVFKWNIDDVQVLLTKCIEWWDADKKFLLEKEKPNIFGSIPVEFKARFKFLVSIFSNIIAPSYEALNEPTKRNVIRILNEFSRYGLEDLEVKVSFSKYLVNKHRGIFNRVLKNLASKNKNEVKDALNAVEKLIKILPEVIEEPLFNISDHIRTRNETELASFLKLMSIVVKKYPQHLNKKILYNLDNGISFLISETKIHSEDSSYTIDLKLSLKEETARLTLALYYYFSLKKKKLPEYINQWKRLCLDNDEFSEIRRVWEDA